MLRNLSTEEFLRSGVFGLPRVVRIQGWLLAGPNHSESNGIWGCDSNRNRFCCESVRFDLLRTVHRESGHLSLGRKKACFFFFCRSQRAMGKLDLKGGWEDLTLRGRQLGDGMGGGRNGRFWGAPIFGQNPGKYGIFHKKMQNRGAPKAAVPTTTHPIPQLTPS